MSCSEWHGFALWSSVFFVSGRSANWCFDMISVAMHVWERC